MKKGEGRAQSEENERVHLRGRAVDWVNRNGFRRNQKLDLRLRGPAQMVTEITTRHQKASPEEGQTISPLVLYTPLLRFSQLHPSFALETALLLQLVDLAWLLRHLHPPLSDHLPLNPNILPLNRPLTRTKKTIHGPPTWLLPISTTS